MPCQSFRALAPVSQRRAECRANANITKSKLPKPPPPPGSPPLRKGEVFEKNDRSHEILLAEVASIGQEDPKLMKNDEMKAAVDTLVAFLESKEARDARTK